MACCQCKHWDEDSKLRNYPDHGECKRADHCDKANAASPMIANARGEYRAQLYTHCDHACCLMTERMGSTLPIPIMKKEHQL